MSKKCDFSGWATRANLKCADGRTIMKGAFAANDGKRVPLVWQHIQSDPENTLGHAILENRDEGVYMYGFFNASPKARAAKEAVVHGDVTGLSIYANQLQHMAGGLVSSGNIVEVSLVHAGANPGAYIDNVLAHGVPIEDEGVIFTGEPLCIHESEGAESSTIQHSAEGEPSTEPAPASTTTTDPASAATATTTTDPASASAAEPSEPDGDGAALQHASEPVKDSESGEDGGKDDKTVQDVIDGMTTEQKQVLKGMIGAAIEETLAQASADSSNNNSDIKEGENTTMKHNVFDTPEAQETTLSHAAQGEILDLAKQNNVGSLRIAMQLYAGEHEELRHGIESIESLFPDYKDLRPGAPELVTRDQGWVNVVLDGVHKSPFSRIRTRQADARGATLRGHGYKKDSQKKPIGDLSLLTRTTDPQTIYVTDSLKRDDILDITDFDVVAYQYSAMRLILNEEIAVDIMLGDGRNDSDDKKVSETHVRSIWNDNELYAIHKDVDIAAAKAELQGTNTGANFGDNYVYAEAVITAALFGREDYKGTGTPALFCAPRLLNKMLLARDLNGRRIYNNKADLTAALNVSDIYTAEQFEGLIRTDSNDKKHKLLGIFVNLADYTVGSTRGGEITKFDDFDIDFNQYKYLLETRISGALSRVNSAVVLEEPVNP